MNLKSLNDRELLNKTQELVQDERNTLTQILHHLREVDRRKLFSDRGYSSLFDYAVRELKYSEGQAGRRIQAMRLLKEMPEIEEKIQSGALSLTSISQAQSYFREINKAVQQTDLTSSEKLKPLLKIEDKIQILAQLENKSSRETERLLLSLNSEVALPKEKQRAISETHTEVRFVMDQELLNQLEKVKSLLGPQSTQMSMAELVKEMALIAEEALKIKKFGKRSVAAQNNKRAATPAPESNFAKAQSANGTNSRSVRVQSRSISKTLKFQIWQRDLGRCQSCGGQHNLQIDHVKPFALGGENSLENLRLLCFYCNQRRSIKTFGPRQLSL